MEFCINCFNFCDINTAKLANLFNQLCIDHNVTVQKLNWKLLLYYYKIR